MLKSEQSDRNYVQPGIPSVYRGRDFWTWHKLFLKLLNLRKSEHDSGWWKFVLKLVTQFGLFIRCSEMAEPYVFTRHNDLALCYANTSTAYSDFKWHREHYSINKCLSHNKLLVIVRPEKCSGVVVLNPCDYVDKMIHQNLPN